MDIQVTRKSATSVVNTRHANPEEALAHARQALTADDAVQIRDIVESEEITLTGLEVLAARWRVTIRRL